MSTNLEASKTSRVFGKCRQATGRPYKILIFIASIYAPIFLLKRVDSSEHQAALCLDNRECTSEEHQEVLNNLLVLHVILAIALMYIFFLASLVLKYIWSVLMKVAYPQKSFVWVGTRWRPAKLNYKNPLEYNMYAPFSRTEQVKDVNVAAIEFKIEQVINPVMHKTAEMLSDLSDADCNLLNDLSVVAIKVFAYAVSMCNCSTRKDQVLLTFNVVLQNFTGDHLLQLQEYFKKMYGEEEEGQLTYNHDNEPFEPQVGLSDFKEFFKGVCTLNETKYPKIFIDTTAALLVGSVVRPNNKMNMSTLFSKLGKNLGKQLGTMKFLDCLVTISEFATGVATHMTTGRPLSSFIMVESIHSRVSELMKAKEDYYAGFEVGRDPHKLLEEAKELNDELKRRLNSKGKQTMVDLQLAQSSLHIHRLIRRIEEDIKTGRVRAKPIFIAFTGGSHLGKSWTSQIAIKMVENVFDVHYEPNEIAYLAADSKYDDAIEARSKVYVIDDTGATKTQGADPSASPLCHILSYVNNAPALSRQASLEKKGNTWCTPDAVILTSNDPTCGAADIYKELDAFTNRVMLVECRPLAKCANRDGSLNRSKAGFYTDERTGKVLPKPHLEFCFYSYKKSPTGFAKIYNTPWFNPGEFMSYATGVFRKFKEDQALYVKALTDVRDMPVCKTCGAFDTPLYCQCNVNSMGFMDVPNATEEELDAEEKKALLKVKESDPAPDGTNPDAVDLDPIVAEAFYPEAGFEMISGAMWDATSTLQQIALSWPELYVPNCMNVMSDYLTRFSLSSYINSRTVCRWIFKQIGWYIFLFCLPIVLFVLAIAGMSTWREFTGMVVVFCLYYALLARGLQRAIRARITSEWNASFRDGRLSKHLSTGITCLATFYILKTLYSSCFQSSKLTMENGAVDRMEMISAAPREPTNARMARKKVEEISDWDKPSIPPPTSWPMQLKTKTLSHVEQGIGKLLWRYEALGINGNCFFVSNNEVMIPRHAMAKLLAKETDPMRIRILFKKSNAPSEQFRALLLDYVDIEDDSGQATDATLVRISQSPAMPNAMIFFSDNEKISVCSNMYTRNEDGNVKLSTLIWTPTTLPKHSAFNPIEGSKHVLGGTAAGDCMSPIVRERTPHEVMGFHCGKNSGYCFAFTMKKGWIERAHNSLNSLLDDDFVLESGKGGKGGLIGSFHPWSGTPRINSLGSDLDPDNPIDPRHPVCFKDNQLQDGITVHGYCPQQRVTSRGRIYMTPLAPIYREAGKMPFGEPKLNANRDHAYYIQQSRVGPLDQATLREASTDYMEPIIEKGKTLGPIQPWTLRETINGIKGDRYAKGMNLNTSAGFPLKGKKDQYFDLYVDEEGEYYMPNGDLMIEYSELMDMASVGMSIQSCAKTACKTEAVKVDPETLLPIKDHNRVFTVLPVTANMILAMYLGPISRDFMIMNATTEFAVGMNVTDYDWGVLYARLMENGEDNCIATDYGNYDVSISSQLMYETVNCIITYARYRGYDKTQAAVLGVLLHDTIRTTVLFNGALMEIEGSNPSGTYATVMQNSVTNSILCRYAWYLEKNLRTRGFLGQFRNQYPPGVKFRDKVQMVTLGDDLIATSKDPNFNQFTMKELGEHINLKVTGHDKKPISRAFVNIHDVEFLKRTFWVQPKHGVVSAPLRLESIFKSFCCLNETKEDYKTIMVQNMENALRELARHPEEVYERERAFMQSATDQLGLSHYIPSINRSYDDWWDEFMMKYYSDERLARVMGMDDDSSICTEDEAGFLDDLFI